VMRFMERRAARNGEIFYSRPDIDTL
jgi:hypothetical protein